MRILNLVILYTFFIGSVYSQSFSYEKCNDYIKRYEDDSLKLYLDIFENKLIGVQLLEHTYLRSLQHRYFNEEEEQLKYLYQGLDLVRTIPIDSIHAFLLDELSLALQKNHSEPDRLEAIELINKSIEIKSDLDNKYQLGKSYLIKGSAYIRQNHESKINQLDSAEYSYSRAIEYLEDNRLGFMARRNLANVFMQKKQYADCISLLKTCLKNEGSLKNKTAIRQLLAKAHIRNRNYKDIQSQLDSSLILTRQKKWTDLTSNVMMVQAELSDSLGHYKIASQWKDSILSLQHEILDNENIEANEKYKSLSLETQLAKEQAKVFKNRLWIALLGGLTIFLSILSFGVYRFYKLKKQTAEQELENTKIKGALDAIRAEMDGEQKERQAIASVLHDHMASSLAAARLHLSVARKNPNNAEAINKAESILSDINEQVRNISHQLVSPALMKFGLTMAIESLTDNMSTEELDINFDSSLGKDRLENPKEVFMYRSCAELLQNILKHSQATQADVQLFTKGDFLCLQVNDNGKNENLKKVNLGLGLINIQNRSEAFGGSFVFDNNESGFSTSLKIKK